MYIKIYFDERPLFLCDAIDETIQPYVHHDDAVFIDELNPHTIKTMIHEMQLSTVHAGVFFNNDLDKLKKDFFKKFTIITAAGGLVLNENNEILIIFRRGKWDLPKGKLDNGEKLEDCAIREVQEETGLKTVKIISPLGISYHTYHEGTKFILKESHWYIMRTSGKQVLTPQTEEDILEIRWVKANDIKNYREDIFPSIRNILDTFLKNA